jgi:hypothetical protein
MLLGQNRKPSRFIRLNLPMQQSLLRSITDIDVKQIELRDDLIKKLIK